MPSLLVVGAGLFGSLAAAYARSKGIDAVVFDPYLEGAASHAAAGLFKEGWIPKKLLEHYRQALPLLDRLYGLRQVSLAHNDGRREVLYFVPPRVILHSAPVREHVTCVGDGWLKTGGQRYEGAVYIAAGVWSGQFFPGLKLWGRAGAAYLFRGERDGRIHAFAPGRQALAFVRDPGCTYFSDGTAERDYTPEHDRQTLARAVDLGLHAEPIQRCWGYRPYAQGGLVFERLGNRTWLATGGRKLGTILAASCARRLIDVELRSWQ
jgi:glycine/D-amino acid oxidase-like deaminating enzyme